jgi:aldose 1-epimerase
MQIDKVLWGKYQHQDICLVTLSNGAMEVSLTQFGATITAVKVPDREGNKRKVVLGYDSLEAYLQDPFYLGCLVGRFANRIARASFRVEEVVYQLPANDPATGNHLHGGVQGFNKKVFELVSQAASEQHASIGLYYRSADGEEGYPGNLDLWVTYALTRENELIITYKAVTDKTTHVNLTNHSYFNLHGTAETALSQQLLIQADSYLVTDKTYIPTGEIKTVADTVYDFRSMRSIDKFWDQVPDSGYNTCFLLSHGPDQEQASLFSSTSGIGLTVQTSFPGILLYTGDYLQEPFQKNQGICLETQAPPDAPNQPGFPATLLHPQQPYSHFTKYRFHLAGNATRGW